MINVEELYNLLHYNPDTGLFMWKLRRSNACTTGWFTGHINKRGYATIRISGKLYLAHRVAWCMSTGSWPKFALDHIDENKTNNTISNLRLATKSLNQLNQSKPHKDANTIFRGVSFDKQMNKYRAQLMVSGKKVLNKLYDTAQEASDMYKKVKEVELS